MVAGFSALRIALMVNQMVEPSGGTISATKEAFASARIHAQCMALGQAAGTTAAICVKEQIDVNELDGSRLRDTLENRGAITRTGK